MDSVEWARLRWEQRNTPGLEYAAASTAVMRLHQIMMSNWDRALRDHDISRTSYLVLSALFLPTGNSLSMSQLSRRIMLHPTTISLAVDQLQNRGLVERKKHPSDGRTTLAVLTPLGSEKAVALNKILADINFGMEGVSERLAITLTEVTRVVRGAMGDT